MLFSYTAWATEMESASDGLRLFEALRDDALHAIAYWEKGWRNTNNPVCVWRAMSLCFRIEAYRRRYCDNAAVSLPMNAAEPFPAWCLEYLSLVCFNISDLDMKVEESNISGTVAKNRLAAALGFTRSTTNAFDRAKALSERQLDDLSFAGLRDEMSEQDAIEALTQEAGLTEPRAMRKRLAEYRKRFC